MLLRKHLPLTDVTLKMEGDTGKFSGYASVFGNVDDQGDVLLRGAFEYTLRNNGKPKMFFNHDWSGIPIGKWEVVKEDAHGLYVEGELTPALTLSQDVRAAMKHGTLDGLSIGGLVKVNDWEQSANGERVIRRWTRLIEISPVVFPANGSARIDTSTVKGGAEVIELISDAASIRELEQLLRDVAGLSKGAATALVARIKAVADQGEPAPTDAEVIQALAERITRLAA